MMQLEKILPSGEISNSTYPRRLYDPQMDLVMGDLDLTFLLTSPEESSVISSNSLTSTMLSNEFFDLSNSNEFFDLPNLDDEIPIASPTEGLEMISSGEISDICGLINGSDCNENVTKLISMDGDEYSPCFSLDSSENSTVFPLTNGSNTFPGDMEMNNEISLHHLLRAYGEAIENRQTELAQVIVNSIAEKRNINPLGTTMERLAFYLFGLEENYSHYLRQESVKHFTEAFKALYQGLPYGRFAHFTANSAILESIPNDATTLHIIDFDIGEGIQWPSLIEAISRTNRGLKFTLIKSGDEISSPHWDIEWTKKRLQDHAREFNLMLQIDEKSVSDLANEVTRMRKSGRGGEWLVFNCMFRLPHTARMRQRSHANEFLKVAKEILTSYGASAGMVTLGYGETEIYSQTCSGYSSFFDELLKHYQAIFESLEQSFPVHLAEARTALESLFLAPHINSLSWFQEWDESKEASDLQLETGLEDMTVSHESLIEAKQIVNDGDNGYNVKITGERENEMVLEWKGTALVKVSTWMQRSN